MSGRNAIVLASDARIFPAAVFAAERLSSLNPRSDTDILVYTDSAADREKVSALALPFAVRPAAPPPGVRDGAYYLRFAILDELAEVYDRILYLDVDIWVESPALFGLFDLDMAGHVFAGVRDPVIGFIPGSDELPLVMGPGNTKYLNTGVLLVDTAQYRAAKVGPRFFRVLREDTRRFHFRDQSILNVILQGNWLELSPGFNLLAIQWNTFVSRVCPPVVVHFAGATKPWMGPHFTYAHPVRAAMERYFPASAWKDFLPRFVNLNAMLDLAKAPPQGNFDMPFRGKPAFVAFLRQTRFADEAAGLVTLHREHLPAV